jgi:hypothetical protein
MKESGITKLRFNSRLLSVGNEEYHENIGYFNVSHDQDFNTQTSEYEANLAAVCKSQTAFVFIYRGSV